MISNRIRYVRFVDDYYIFANSLEESHSRLSFLTDKLMRNEGLSLQKHKTQIISNVEFINLIKNRVKGEGEDRGSKEKARFMSLPIKYDPYSPNAKVDYDKIKDSLKDFNILSLLNEELQKSKIHQQFSKRLIQSLDIAENDVVSEAFKIIVQKYQILYPIFPIIMIAAFKNFYRLNKDVKKLILDSIVGLFTKKSHIIQNDLNVAYAIRIIGLEPTYKNELFLVKLYERTKSELIKSICLQIMIRWKKHYFISDLRTQFSSMKYWQRRMFIIGSFILTDEGEHWRRNNNKNFSNIEQIIKQWADNNFKKQNWLMPI